MGARIYLPGSGQFASTDPVFGGNTNPYTYPADPINNSDLNGQLSWWKKARNAIRDNWKTYATVAVFAACVAFSGGICLAAGAALAGANYYANGKKYGYGSGRALGGLVQDVAWLAVGGAMAAGASKFLLGSASKFLTTDAFEWSVRGLHSARGSVNVINYGATVSNMLVNAEIFVGSNGYGTLGMR